MSTVTVSSDSYHSFVLAQLRVAAIRARLLVNEVDAIGVALAGHIIDAEAAAKLGLELGILVDASSAIVGSTT
jgi:hypothetical protein